MKRLLFALGAMFCNALWATTVVPPSFDELASEADFVVRARVTELASVESEHSGKRVIHTRITLDVIDTIAGTPPSPLVLTMLGGRVGDREMRVAGVPSFVVGQEEIFFVKDNGLAFYPTYAVMHGRYPIKRDKATGREYLTRTNGVPLTDVAEIGTPVAEGGVAALQRRARSATDALAPADLAARVRSVREAREKQGGVRAK